VFAAVVGASDKGVDLVEDMLILGSEDHLGLVVAEEDGHVRVKDGFGAIDVGIGAAHRVVHLPAEGDLLAVARHHVHKEARIRVRAELVGAAGHGRGAGQVQVHGLVVAAPDLDGRVRAPAVTEGVEEGHEDAVVATSGGAGRRGRGGETVAEGSATSGRSDSSNVAHDEVGDSLGSDMHGIG
jgi:hypothetical protein